LVAELAKVPQSHDSEQVLPDKYLPSLQDSQ
jgi:hypothetical protein